MKTNEELNKLKEEVESINAKLSELTEEELKQVTGGSNLDVRRPMKTHELQIVHRKGRVIVLNKLVDRNSSN